MNSEEFAAACILHAIDALNGAHLYQLANWASAIPYPGSATIKRSAIRGMWDAAQVASASNETKAWAACVVAHDALEIARHEQVGRPADVAVRRI